MAIDSIVKKYRINEYLDIIDKIEADLEKYTLEHPFESARDYKNLLFHTMKKSIVTIKEILILCSEGYSDGAISLSRNLYEQLVTVIFFEIHKKDQDFQDYVYDYYLDFDIQQSKRRKKYFELVEHDKEQAHEIESEIQKLKEKAKYKGAKGDGKQVGKDWWWTRQNSFMNMESATIDRYIDFDSDKPQILGLLKFSHKLACTSIHAGCLGNTERFGEEFDFSVLYTGNSDRGQSACLFATCASFNRLCILFYRYLD